MPSAACATPMTDSRVPAERLRRSARPVRDVPQVHGHRPVEAGRRERAAVRAERDAPDLVRLASQRLAARFACAHVPQADLARRGRTDASVRPSGLKATLTTLPSWPVERASASAVCSRRPTAAPSLVARRREASVRPSGLKATAHDRAPVTLQRRAAASSSVTDVPAGARCRRRRRPRRGRPSGLNATLLTALDARVDGRAERASVLGRSTGARFRRSWPRRASLRRG